MRLFLITCLFVGSLLGNESWTLPQAPSLHTVALQKGVTLYSQEHTSVGEWASLRVILQYGSNEHALFAFDSKEPNWEGLEEFVFACSREAKEGHYLPLKAQFPSSFSALLNDCTPRAVSIIAVGSFDQDYLTSLLNDYFQDIALTPQRHPTLVNFSSELEHAQAAVSLSFPHPFAHIETPDDLTHCWTTLLMQELLQERLESCTKKGGSLWIHPHPQSFYPASGFALVKEDALRNLLAFFLWHIEVVKNQGFYDACFSAKKNQFLYRLSYLLAQEEENSCATLSSYYADLIQIGLPPYAFHPFLLASIDTVNNIQFEDLLPSLDHFMAKQKRHIHVVYPQSARLPIMDHHDIDALEEEISDLASYYLSDTPQDEDEEQDDDFPMLTSWIMKANTTSSADFILAANNSSFYQLPLSSKEKEIITYIITHMAENNIFQLAMQKSTMEKKGKKIDHVHPLRFMGHIMGNSVLKNHIRTIKKSSFKWDALIDGFSKKMREQVSKNNVYPHLSGFAETVGSTPEKLTPYIQRGDFEGLVKSLL